MRKVVVHLAAILIVFAVGTGLGVTFRPGSWYEALEKPWFTPPGWVFGPVWTVLYVMIGWAGARKLLYGGQRALWVGQMALNWSWSAVFFGLHLPIGGLLVILAMLAFILAFIVREWQADRLSAMLFLPYAAWVTLASAVNAGVVWLN